MCDVGGEHTREWVYARVVQALKRATKRPLKLTLHRAMGSHDTGASPLVSISQTRLMAPPGTRAELLDSSFVRVGDDAGLRRVAEALGAVALQPAEFAMRHVLPRVETLPMELREAAMATVACHSVRTHCTCSSDIVCDCLFRLWTTTRSCATRMLHSMPPSPHAASSLLQCLKLCWRLPLPQQLLELELGVAQHRATRLLRPARQPLCCAALTSCGIARRPSWFVCLQRHSSQSQGQL